MKTNDQIFFWSISQFLGQKFFHEIELLCKLLKGFWHHAKIQRILMIQLQENTQMLEGKGGQTLFHRILPATTMGLTSKTAVNSHLKVKDIEYNVGLTKSYFITISMQKSA